MVKLVPNTKSKVKTASNTEVNEQEQANENQENQNGIDMEKEMREEGQGQGQVVTDPNANVKVTVYSPEIKDIDIGIEFPYNTRTLESYRKLGFKPPDEIDYQERNFLSKVNPKKYSIQRVVTRVVRLKARDYSLGNHVATKEYLVYYENWYGKNWLGEDIAPVADHIEGMYLEQEKKVITNTDYRTGRMMTSFKRGMERPMYYIPFSKENVEKILKDTEDKDSVIYTIKLSPPYSGGIRTNFSYDQFLNLSFDEAFRKCIQPGGPLANPLSANNSLSFQPT